MFFLSSTLQRQKKVISIFLLLCITIGMVIPQITYASAGACVWGILAGTVAAIGTGLITAGAASIPVGAAIIAAGCYGGNAIESAVTEGKTSFLTDIIAGTADIIQYGTHMLATMSADLLQSIVDSKFLTTTISSSDSYVAGWSRVRDLSNMFIVLGFVIIGIAFTLRLEGYGSKKMLLNLILIALLVNFSGVFCGAMIDASNLITKNFLLGGGEKVGTKIVTSIEKVVAANDWDAMYKTDVRTYLAWDVFYGVYYLLATIVFFYLGFLLFARQAVFSVLYILSPLAFVCWVFPPTKKLWNMWWENFIKWGLIGAQIAFFAWLGAETIGTNYTLRDCLTTLILLFVAGKIAKKSSATGAGAIIGLATTGAMTVMSGGTSLATKGLKTGLKNLQGTKTGQTVSNATGKALEWAGLRAKGTTAINQQNRLKESTDRLSKGYADNAEGNEGLAKIASQRAVTAKQREDKASAAKILAERKALGKVGDKNKQDEVAKFATSMGVSKDTFTKSNPELTLMSEKEKNKAATEQLKNEEKIRLEKIGGYTPDKIAAQVKAFKPSEATLSAKKAEISKAKATENKLGFKEVTDTEAAERYRAEQTVTPQQIADAKDKLNKENMRVASITRSRSVPPSVSDKEAEAYVRSKLMPNSEDVANIKSQMTKERIQEKNIGFVHATKDDARQHLIDTKTKELRDSGSSGRALNDQLGRYMKGIASSDIEAAQNTVNQERISSAIKKLSGEKAAELSTDAIDDTTITMFNKNQLEKMIERGSGELSDKVNNYKKMTMKGTSEYDEIKQRITSLPRGPEKDALIKMHMALRRKFK